MSKKVMRILLAIYVLCWLVLFLTDGLLLIGQVSAWDIMGVLFWIGLLALIVWGTQPSPKPPGAGNGGLP